ncbi:MAG: hypothetical protein F7C08_04040 [Desulfurococcales archaeon]|nr:hypothetical protein [Desulfurococcales archaeon]MCE4605684.1 hypothetical protein [Desulfurococcales archaeon]
MAKGKVRVRVVWYKIQEEDYGGVLIEVLKPVKEYLTEEAGDPVDVILRVSEASSKASTGDYFEVIVEDRDVKRIMGESPRRGQRRRSVERIFPRPAKLLRVGILRVSQAGDEGGRQFRVEDAEWHAPRGEVYVYEGRVRIDEGVAAVIVDTDAGREIIVRGRSRRRKLSQPHNGS